MSIVFSFVSRICADADDEVCVRKIASTMSVRDA